MMFERVKPSESFKENLRTEVIREFEQEIASGSSWWIKLVPVVVPVLVALVLVIGFHHRNYEQLDRRGKQGNVVINNENTVTLNELSEEIDQLDQVLDHDEELNIAINFENL